MSTPLNAEAAKPVAASLREIAKRVRERGSATVDELFFCSAAYGLITGEEDGKNVDAFAEGLDDGPEGFAGFCERLADKAEQVEVA